MLPITPLMLMHSWRSLMITQYVRLDSDVHWVGHVFHLKTWMGQSWPWSYCSWIYNYLCNQCLSLLMLWIRMSLRWPLNTGLTVLNTVKPVYIEPNWGQLLGWNRQVFGLINNILRFPIMGNYLRNKSWKPECVGNLTE
jgi:hypothetical protein